MKPFKILLLLFISSAFLTCEKPEFDSLAQFNRDIKTIDKYLDDNGIDAFTDPSGIRFTIESIGTAGLPPKRSHVVEVNYVGKLLADGKIFEQGTATGPVTSFIPGWIEALEILPVGTEATIYIPSPMGYGNQGIGIIPRNSILVFDIELVSVSYSSQEEQQFPIDVAAIDQYLEDNSIDAFESGTGIRYVVTEIGAGPTPSWFTKIRASYTGKLLSSGTEFFSGTVEPNAGFDSRVVDFLPGLQATFLNLPAGSKATVYIPSVLGFGTAGAGNGLVPANANLIYEIESLEIVN